jgi:hypothetical protein
MPFTLAHPAAILPLVRRPFVPAALVAGATAPDVPYFLTAAGVTSTSAGDWYEPFLNATHTHSLSGVPIDLLYAIGLAAIYWTMRAPITALLPSGLGVPEPERPNGVRATGRYAAWLLLSALIGIGTHLLWDSLTEADFLPSPRLLQYASTAFGLAVVGWFLWKRRADLRTHDAATHRLGAAMRRVVATLLIAAPLLGAAALAHDDYNDYRAATDSWSAVAEGVLTGAVKRAGASFAIALLLYAAVWQLVTSRSEADFKAG